MAVVDERRFRAMGSDCHVVVVGGRGELLDLAARRIADLEQRWSRFLPASEVSMMNGLAGVETVVSWETFELVARAIDAWRDTGGAFDPTVLTALAAAGYDRSFELMASLGDAVPEAALPAPGCSGVVLDECRGSVLMPGGVAFDPGGIGKGLGADIVTRELIEAGASGAMVNLGGDLSCAGTGPGNAPWSVGIADPFALDLDVATVAIGTGGVATSTTLRKTWVRGGRRLHHLVDPSSGRPMRGPYVAVTVLAACAWRAEAAAKAVMACGRSAWPEESTLVVDGSGVVDAGSAFDMVA
jgi:FAD:protein FMN transferase